MKHTKLICLFSLLLPYFVQAQTVVDIPDLTFKNCLIRQFVDKNNDGQIQYSEAEVTTTLTIAEFNLNSLKGLEAFSNLTSLTFGITNIKTLDLSALTKLSYLICSDTDIDSVNLSKNTALKYLHLDDTKLKGLDISKNILLDSVLCTDNPVKWVKIPQAPNLKKLICYYNQLTELDVTKCPALEVLECYGNQLTSLDLSKCLLLKQAYCYSNKLNTLNINGCSNLLHLQAQSNLLKEVNVATNISLSTLIVSGNILRSIDVKNCKALKYLACVSNIIKAIDISPCTELVQFHCMQNYLANLDLRKNPKLTQVFCSNNLSLDSIFITEDQLAQTSRTFDWVKDNFAVWATGHTPTPVPPNKWTKIPGFPIYNAHELWVGASHLAVMSDNVIYYLETGTFPYDNRKILYPPTDISNQVSNSIFIKKADYNENIFFLLIKDPVVNRNAILKISIYHNIYEHTYIGNEGDVLNDLSYNSDNKIVVAGNNGVIINFDISTNTYERFIIPEKNNLTAISASHNFAFAAGNGVLLKINFLPFSSDTIGAVDKEVKVIASNGPTHYGIGGANLTSFFDQKPEITKALHDFGILNVRDISSRSGLYIATQKGLFSAPGQGNGLIRFLQFAPEHSAEDIIRLGAYNNKLYALTADGQILVTNTETMALKPYASINSTISCAKEQSELKVTYPMEGTYKWFYDDIVVSRSPSYYHVADSGRYTLSVVIKKGLYADTASTLIHILNKPEKFISLTIPDTTICKNQSALINLFNTDTLFRYNLTSTDLLQNYGSVRGNGSNAVLTTGSLWENEFGKFRIWTKSAYSDCNQYTDSIYTLKIERTKASFIYDEINPGPGEDVHFYSKSNEAATFAWNFGPGNQPLSSSLKDPVIKFNTVGETNIRLKVTSLNGCPDSILWKGPTIINEKALPALNCWTTNMFNKDPDWGGYYRSYFQDMKLIEGNDMIVSGHYNNNTFKSKFGQSVHLPDQSGGYIARYSKNGALKWIVKSKREFYSNSTSYSSSVNSVFVDSANNIFATAIMDTRSPHFQFSRGDTVDQKYKDGLGDYGNWLFKTDKNGALLLHARLVNSYPQDVTVDRLGNIVTTGWLTSTPENFIYIGGGDSLHPLKSLGNDPQISSYRFILKTDPKGKLLWANYIEEDFRDYTTVNEISTDKAGNIYLSGDFSTILEFHSVDSLKGKARAYSPPAGSGPYFFVAKYSSKGDFLWETMAYSNDNAKTHVQDMQVMDNGTIYITGSNFVYSEFMTMKYQHSDGTSSSSSVGGFFVSKLNSEGKEIWTSGNRYTYYGGGTAIDVKGSKLAVTAYFEDNFNMFEWTNIISTDETQTPIKLDNSKIFVLEYDTSGVLKSVSPMNIGFGPSSRNIASIKWADDKTIYYGVEAYGNNASSDSTFTPFCDEISLSQYDGFWGKMMIGIDGINNISLIENSSVYRAVKIYPNPSASDFTIEAPADDKLISITLLNMQGQEIVQKKLTLSVNQFSYKTDLPNGMYNIRIQTDKATYLQKLVIAKD